MASRGLALFLLEKAAPWLHPLPVVMEASLVLIIRRDLVHIYNGDGRNFLVCVLLCFACGGKRVNGTNEVTKYMKTNHTVSHCSLLLQYRS